MSASISFHDVMQWTDEQCREYLEAQRWPDGPICPKCGSTDPYTVTRKTSTKNVNRKLYKCRDCKKQYTATVGTIFEDSKVPLNKWFASIYLMCSSKKGVSAHQIHRMLGVTYKTAWFMCHRVREAIREKYMSPLTGVIEVDETYVGGKTRRGHPIAKHEREKLDAEARGEKVDWRGGNKKGQSPFRDKAPVFGILERGGRVRTLPVPHVDSRTLRPIMIQNIDMAQLAAHD